MQDYYNLNVRHAPDFLPSTMHYSTLFFFFFTLFFLETIYRRVAVCYQTVAKHLNKNL